MLEMTVLYEPPVVEAGSRFDIANPGTLAEGVRGYAILTRGEIYIPLIEGDGDGHVGTFLDSLSHRCVIVNVINSRLQGMLIRRNWECTYSDEGYSEWRRKIGK
jgi:hypothetical protein